MIQPTLRPAILAVCVFVGVRGPMRALAEPETSSAEIKALVRQLGVRSYDKRREAQRRLCELGPGTLDALRAAAKDASPEVAIRAREIIHTLSQLLFSGVKVTLIGPQDPVAWDDSFNLVVVMENASSQPANVPIFPESQDPARISPVALQAARMIDLGDYLIVTGPNGKPVQLHVDDMMEIAPLSEAINLRLADDTVDTLAAGERRRVVLDAFNRGWARYRLFEAGDYPVKLVYEPAWIDDELRRRHVGRVESNSVTVRVKQSAPPAVRRDGRQIIAQLSRKKDRLVAELVGTGDLPVHVNTSLGKRLGRTATVSWVVRWKDRVVEFKQAPTSSQQEKLVKMNPGDRLTIASLPIAELFQRPALEDVPLGDTVTVAARYTNLLSRAFVRGGRPGSRKKFIPPGMTAKDFAAKLPARLYSGSPPSNTLELAKPR